ncbi:hypothetical protein NDU88_011142 [Pleurodeles waltl]|uniref:Uncharacterized protein n=1 Tax=Pleurodeles waltl TaxID=8319 RepID=A0AAV7PXM3_PLEWA|nr:hypothetical protein NDU88_011142 [Pleurodeles waltl]
MPQASLLQRESSVGFIIFSVGDTAVVVKHWNRKASAAATLWLVWKGAVHCGESGPIEDNPPFHHPTEVYGSSETSRGFGAREEVAVLLR